MRSLLPSISILSIFASLALATAQSNSTSHPISDGTHTVLQRYPLPQLPGWESRLVYVEYPPGSRAPLHNHPVPGLGYVISGVVISGWEDGNVEYYPTNSSFMDLGDTLHVVAGDADEEVPLRFVINYVIPIDEANFKAFEAGFQ